MAILNRGFVLAVSLLATACTSVYTVDDVVTETAAIRDDRLVGDWREADGDNRARVVRGMNNDYVVTFIDQDDSVQFRARLGRVGSTAVVDVFPDLALWKQREENGFPTHSVFAIEITRDSVGIRGLNADSAQVFLATGKVRVPFTRAGGDMLLHGSPAGVRAALAQLFQQRPVVEDAVWYRRASGASLQADKAERDAMIGFLRSLLTAQEVFFVDSARYATKVSSLSRVQVPATMTVKAFVAGAQFWNMIVTSSRLPGVECAVAVGSINPLSSAAAEGQPICK